MGVPMKKISILVALCLSVLLASCSDDKVENKAQAERHKTSAKMYQGQGQLNAAMLEAKNAIKMQPDSAAGYILLANIYNEIGAYGATQTMLEKVVKELPEVASELAQAYLENKKFRTAINILETYPAGAENSADQVRQAALVAMANIYLGDTAAYEEAIQKVKKLEGSDSELKYLEANYLLTKSKVDEAASLLRAALESEPDSIKILTLLASINVYNHKLDEAEKNLTSAISLLPKTDILTSARLQVLTLLTDTLIQQGRTSEAYTYQKVIAEASPESNAAQQRFNEAMEMYQQGKFAEAEVILNELREQFPQDKKTATLLGMVEYQKGADEKASDLFDQFIDPETATPTVIQAAALVKYRSNKMDEALELLKSATENQPNNAAILATYGLALLDRDDKSVEGARALEKSLALDPKQQRVRIALAKRYKALDQPEQALAQLQKAYEAQPLDIMVQQVYLKSLFQNDQADKVKDEIQEFKRQFSDNARGPFMEGWYFMELKEYSAAEQAFEKSLSMKSNNEKQLAYSGLAQIFEIQNQPQKAVNAWQQAITADPDMTAAYGRWYKIMLELKRDKEVINFLQGLEKAKTNWQPSVVLAQLMVNNKQLPQALTHIKIALERSNNANHVKQIAASLYQAQAMQHRSKNELGPARVSMLEAIKLYPENPDYLANLIQIELIDKKIPEAQRLLDAFSKSDKNEGARLFLQGVIRFAEEKPEEGIKLFRQSWGETPTEGVADAIYTYYQRNKEEGIALTFAGDWVEKLPQSAKANLIKAIGAQTAGDKSEAKKWYEKVIELSPNMAVALNNLAWMYYEDKDKRALSLAKKAADLAPESPEVLDTYGWILVETGDVKMGLNVLEKAASLKPDNLDIQDHLSKAKTRQ